MFRECRFDAAGDKFFAFYTTRHGGFSKGNYGEMNCTHYCGDDITDVMRNRELLVSALPCRIDRLVIPRQTHGNNILTVDDDFLSKDDGTQQSMLYGVDGLVSSCRNICLCISTADCVPLLLYSPDGVIAAVHAGWRGTVSGIVRRAIDVMCNGFGCVPSDIVACIGPSISVEAFEVGNEVYDAFDAAGFDMDSVAVRNAGTGKWHIDLWKANADLMKLSGIKEGNIYCQEVCTWKNFNDVFSARRLGINSGRILSGIVLK